MPQMSQHIDSVFSGSGCSGPTHTVPQLSLAVSDDGLPTRATPHLLVFSGGTAFNSVAGYMRKIYPRVSHVLPVSDDGGSTAEIVRVLGGPAVGDIRSRCLRLADDHNDEAKSVKRLLGYRLSSWDEEAAKREWYSIVEGDHQLWGGVSEPYKHTIRAFLVHFNTTILSQSTCRFSFRNGSVGNFFFAGARTFFRSLDAAIFLFSRVARLPLGSAVLPAISTEERITLGAELADGTRIRGQNDISHPPAARGGASIVDKDGADAPLGAAIKRVFYLSREGAGNEHEVVLAANERVIRDIAATDAIIYGMGSLYTSIAPSLVLQGVGEAVAARAVPKILLLNGSHDRETSACLRHPGPMTATDFVRAVSSALNREGGRGSQLLNHASAYVNIVMVPEGSGIAVDEDELAALGVEKVKYVQSHRNEKGRHLFDADKLLAELHTLFFELKLERIESMEA